MVQNVFKEGPFVSPRKIHVLDNRDLLLLRK